MVQVYDEGKSTNRGPMTSSKKGKINQTWKAKKTTSATAKHLPAATITTISSKFVITSTDMRG